MINLWKSCSPITWKLCFQNNRFQSCRWKRFIMAFSCFARTGKFLSVVSLLRFQCSFLTFPLRLHDLSFAFAVCLYYLTRDLILCMQAGSYYKSNPKAYHNLGKIALQLALFSSTAIFQVVSYLNFLQLLPKRKQLWNILWYHGILSSSLLFTKKELHRVEAKPASLQGSGRKNGLGKGVLSQGWSLMLTV